MLLFVPIGCLIGLNQAQTLDCYASSAQSIKFGTLTLQTLNDANKSFLQGDDAENKFNSISKRGVKQGTNGGASAQSEFFSG